MNKVQYDFLGAKGEITIKDNLDLFTDEQLKNMCIEDYLEKNIKITGKLEEKENGIDSKK